MDEIQKAYASARPPYPDSLYDCLVERCGLKRGSAVEIGPGTGLATNALLVRGADPLCAIEPDPHLANFLRKNVTDRALQIKRCAFEDVKLPLTSFDLGVAATSFHWLDESRALAKVKGLLLPGGWWAMWWMCFGSDGAIDPFEAATNYLFAQTPDSPSRGIPGGPPFALDSAQRLADLEKAGLTEPQVDRWSHSLTLKTHDLVRLYNTFSPIQALASDRRAWFLEKLAGIADEHFGGIVERPVVTQLYTARNPADH